MYISLGYFNFDLIDNNKEDHDTDMLINIFIYWYVNRDSTLLLVAVAVILVANVLVVIVGGGRIHIRVLVSPALGEAPPHPARCHRRL